MITIGKKIKKLRTEKQYSQESIYPKNPSQVSLIESGKIKNPAEFIIRAIAKNLETTFEVLISGTDWHSSKGILGNQEGYAFSPNDYDLEIDDKSGKINILFKSYPVYNEKGEKNKFCPDTGKELVVSCSHCDRSIDKTGVQFCMGCGRPLKIISGINRIQSAIENLQKHTQWMGAIRQIAEFDDCFQVIEYIKKCKSNIVKDWNNNQHGEDIGSDNLELYQYFDNGRHDLDPKEFTVEEWELQTESSVCEIRRHWEDYYASLEFYDKILILMNICYANISDRFNKQKLKLEDETIEQFHMRMAREAKSELRLWDTHEKTGMPYWELYSLQSNGDPNVDRPRSPEELRKVIEDSQRALLNISKKNKKSINKEDDKSSNKSKVDKK